MLEYGAEDLMVIARSVSLVMLVFLAVPTVARAVADVQLISQGRAVEMERHLVSGKFVVFDFYADWCAPCRVLTPRLESLAAQHPDRLAIRKVDVINWESPVAQQMGISSLPYLVLFGPDGQKLSAGGATRVLRILGDELGGGGEGVRHAAGSGVPTWVFVTLSALLLGGSVAIWVRGRRPEDPAHIPAEPPAQVSVVDGPPKIWFAMLGDRSQGPFSMAELGDLRRSGSLGAGARVRRTGDLEWRSLDDELAAG